MPYLRLLVGGAILATFGVTSPCAGDDSLAEGDVRSAMRRAAAYFRDRLAVQGGYVYYYSPDLKVRWGEGRATRDQVWVQPPGTPTVGLAFLRAYRATGDDFYLSAAREAADVLAYGQLRSGGWTNAIDCRARADGYPYEGGKRRREGNSSLDDGQTQSAIQLVALVDQALDFKHQRIHDSALGALNALLKAQFANGGFPQVWRQPVSVQPVRKANYPQHDWRTEGRIKNYWDMYTINDNVCGYVADALITAHGVYRDERYMTALKRLGDFLILAQMPEPQPAWAQQYNYDMQPIWARKFEPAGVSGDESQEVMETLLKISRFTGDAKYLEPIPSALAYLRRSLLPDGRLARYYELKTNRPLYMMRRGKQYSLTYDDSRLPRHYGWKGDSRLQDIERQYRELKAGRRQVDSTTATHAEVRRLIESLDADGRWVSTYDGEALVGQPKFAKAERYVSSAVFSRNLETLSDFLARNGANRN